MGNLSHSNVTRTSADAEFTITSEGASAVTSKHIYLTTTQGDYSNPIQTINNNTGSFTGLTANTTYYAKGDATNSIGTSETPNEDTFTTTGNNPTISSITSSPSKNYATLTGTVVYDTNANFSSVEVQWGTSTNYGNTSNAWRIPESGSTLAQNTTYYYRARVTDTFNRTSSWKTGSFTTSGDKPVINSVTTNPDLMYCEFTPSVTYANNAQFKSMTVQWGKTTTYTEQETYTQPIAFLQVLDSKQTYYYSVTVTDNFDRVSTAYTGSFTTTASAP